MIAVVLSPKARELIRANRDVRRPTAEDRERVAAALRARLGATELPLDTPIRAPRMSIGVQRRFATAFGLCVVGSVLFLARRPGTAMDPTTQAQNESVETVPPATSTSPPSPVGPLLEAPLTPAPEIAPPAPRHTRPRSAPLPPAQDTLAQELALMTRAASQLSSRQPSAALVALEEHQRRFSHGMLSDERNVAKARALCMLHRFDEGRAAIARLANGTPAAARVKEECDSARARAHTAESSHAGERN